MPVDKNFSKQFSGSKNCIILAVPCKLACNDTALVVDGFFVVMVVFVVVVEASFLVVVSFVTFAANVRSPGRKMFPGRVYPERATISTAPVVPRRLFTAVLQTSSAANIIKKNPSAAKVRRHLSSTKQNGSSRSISFFSLNC